MSIEEAQDDTLEVCDPEPKCSKRPTTKKDYKNDEVNLPSAKTILDYKYLQASQAESDVALAMLTVFEFQLQSLWQYNCQSRFL